METLLRFILSAMVDIPDEVRVKQIKGSNGLAIYEVRVATGDTGKIIGKQGRNVSAIRAIIDAAAKKNKERALIQILE